MQRRRPAGLIVLALLCLASCGSPRDGFLAEYPTIDILIRNANVLDGIGGPVRMADVAVVGERIVFVGDTAFSDGDLQTRVLRQIDAAKRYVTPGFIDLHSHGDLGTRAVLPE